MESVKIIFVGSDGSMYNKEFKKIADCVDANIIFEPYQEPVSQHLYNFLKKEEEKRKENQNCRALTRDEMHNQYRKHVLRMTEGRKRHNGK